MGRVIVIAELEWVGHFETQMKLFVEILLKRGCTIIVLCPQPQVMEYWVNSVLPEYRDRFCASYFANDHKQSFIKKIMLWRSLRECIHMVERNTGWTVDIVLLTWLDGLFPDARWQSPFIRASMTYPWVGLYFKPSIYIKDVKMSWRKRIRRMWRNNGIFKANNCCGIGILNEGSYAGLSKRIGEKPIITIPDVTDEKLPVIAADTVLKIRRKAGKRPIIGLIGVLAPRKGVLNFLRLAAAIDPSQCFFLLAGKLVEDAYVPAERKELKRLLELGNNENCFFNLEYIADAAMVNSLANVCDILYLAYHKFYHSSGFLTKAAVFKKPVIVSKGYCMGKRVEEYKLGVTVNEDDLEQIVEAAKYLIDKTNRDKLIEQAEFDEYHTLHKLPMLEQALSKMLKL